MHGGSFEITLYSSFDNAYMSYSSEIELFRKNFKKLLFYGNPIGKSSVNEQKLSKVKSKKIRKSKERLLIFMPNPAKNEICFIFSFLSRKLHHMTFV